MVWSRCSPLDHILSTQHLRIPHLSGSEPLPAPARAFPSLRKAIGLSLYAGEYTSANTVKKVPTFLHSDVHCEVCTHNT